LWRLKRAPEAEKVWALRTNCLNHLTLNFKGKTCTRRKGKRSHSSPPISLVNCRKCHAAKCFSHILQEAVHASEALLAKATDLKGVVWHGRHQEARGRNIPPLASVPLVHELNTLGRRVFFAQHFSSTSPLEPGMTIGFYDAPFQDESLVSFCQYPLRHVLHHVSPALRGVAYQSFADRCSPGTTTPYIDTDIEN
jgi:hypothetical protein